MSTLLAAVFVFQLDDKTSGISRSTDMYSSTEALSTLSDPFSTLHYDYSVRVLPLLYSRTWSYTIQSNDLLREFVLSSAHLRPRTSVTRIKEWIATIYPVLSFWIPFMSSYFTVMMLHGYGTLGQHMHTPYVCMHVMKEVGRTS